MDYDKKSGRPASIQSSLKRLYKLGLKLGRGRASKMARIKVAQGRLKKFTAKMSNRKRRPRPAASMSMPPGISATPPAASSSTGEPVATSPINQEPAAQEPQAGQQAPQPEPKPQPDQPESQLEED